MANILIIDDDPVYAGMMEQRLVRAKTKIRVAGTGEVHMAWLGAFPGACVIVPAGDACRVFRTWRWSRSLSGLYVLGACQHGLGRRGLGQRGAGCRRRGIVDLQRFGQSTDIGLPDAGEAECIAPHIVLAMIDGAAQSGRGTPSKLGRLHGVATAF